MEVDFYSGNRIEESGPYQPPYITLVGVHTKQIVSSCFKFIVSDTISMTSSVSHLLPTKLHLQVVGLKLVVDQTLSLKC